VDSGDNCSGSPAYHVVTTVADSGASTSKKYTAGTPITGYVVPAHLDFPPNIRRAAVMVAEPQ